MQEALQQAGIANNQGAGSVQGGHGRGNVNVGEIERWASSIGGGALALYGSARLITQGSVGGAVLALVGGSLIYRGATGHCEMYHQLGINTTGTGSSSSENPVVSVPAGRGIKV